MIVDWAVRGTWRDSIVKTSIGLTLGLLATGCGQDYTGLFSRLPKQQLIFPNGDLGSALRLPNLISSKVDVLWIVESSSKINDVVGNDTMINQVVDGIQQFSDNYFNANNDFQMAVIPANYAPVLALDENEIPTNLNDPNFVNAPIVAPVFSSIPPSGSNIAQQKAAYIKAFTDIQDSVLNKNNITPPAAASTQGVFSYIRFLHKHEDRNFCSETSPDPLKRCLFRKGAIHAVFIVIKSCDSGAWNANLDYLAAASWKDSPFSLTVLPATGLTCVGNIGRVNPNQQCCGNHSSPSGGPYPPGVPISSNDSVSKPYFPGGFGSRDECHPMYSISRGPANNVGGGNFLDLHRYTMHFFTQLQQSQSKDIHYFVQGIGGNAVGGFD